MSIQSPVGTLDIKNATLRVGKLEVSNIQGVDTALNVTRSNAILIYDDQVSTTTFTGFTSSTGVRDTGNGYLDLAGEYVYWGQKLPNSWVMEFEMDIRSGTSAGPLYSNIFSTSNVGGDGYTFTFNDNNDKITLKYDGTTLTEATVSGLFTASENWQKVAINYERGRIAISIGASRKFFYQDIERSTPYVNGEYVNFSSASTDGRKIRNLKITNGTKWTYAGESNVAFQQGSVGIGVTDPAYTLDVGGDINLSGSFYQGGSPFVSSLWTDGANSLYYRSNVEVGTGNLFVDTTTSNVGIRTTTPAYELDVAGNVHADYFLGDGSLLTGLVTKLEDVVDNGNVSSNTIQLTNTDVGLKATGNVEAARFIGDGSHLTGLVTDLQSVSDNGNTTSNTIQFTNATTGFVTESNVGIANTNPQNDLDVGSNLSVLDTGSNVLSVTGNVSATSITIGDFQIVSAYGLDHVTNENNQTTDTIISTNATTGFNASSNIVAGGTVQANKIVSTSNLEVGTANLFVDTTTSRVGIGTTTPGYDLDVNGDINFTGTFYQGGSTFVSSLWTSGNDSLYYTASNVGIGTDTAEYTLDVHGNANVGALTTTSVSGDGSALYGIQSSNVSDFASNVSRIGTLETDLGSNATRIGTLETDLGSNATRIGTLETDLGSNATRIGTLETDLGSNATRIGTLETDLGSNATRIGTLETDLGSNATRIGTLETDLSDNSSRITSIESGAHTFTGIKTFEGDVILESNLRINGDLLVANTVHMIVSDPIMELGANNINTGDLGIIMTRHGETGNVAIVYDESQDVLNVGYTLSNAYGNTITMDTANSLTLQVNGALNVGSNIVIDDTASNVIEVSGNVKTDSLFLGNFEVVASHGLSHVTAVSAATNDTVYLNNPTTGLVVVSNVSVGENLDVTSNLTVSGNTVVSQELSVSGNTALSSNLTVSGNTALSSNLFVTGNVGIGTTEPTESLDIVGNLNFQKVSNTASIKLNSNIVMELPKHDRPLVKYPEVAMTAATTAGYTVDASRYGASYDPFKAFNGLKGGSSGDVGWHTGTATPPGISDYTGTNNTYVGTERLSSETVLGEWITIELPNPIKLIDTHLWAQFNYAHVPKGGVFYGKRNASDTWTQLYSYTGQAIVDRYHPQVHTINETRYFKYFAYVATERYLSASGISVGEWELYGTEEGDTSVDVVHRSIPNKPGQQHLEVYWDANDSNSYSFADSSSVYDLSGNGVTGTLANGVGFDTEYKAFTFDGVDDSISATSIGNSVGDWTHSSSFWFKFDVVETVHFYSIGPNTSSGQNVTALYYNTSGYLQTSVSGGVYTRFENVFLLPNHWYHITTVKRTNAQDSIYLNGNELPVTVYGNTGLQMSLPANTSLNIGTRPDQSSVAFFDGSIANFRLYSKALNADQVKELYDYQKDYFLGSKSQVTLYKGHLGVGVTEPSGQLELAGDERLQEYPPGPMSDYETLIPGHGVFCAYAGDSEAYAISHAFHAWEVFNDSSDIYHGGQRYTGTDRAYVGSIQLHGQGIKGDYIVLEMPYQIKVQSVTLGNSQNRMPKDFTIVGSNDGSTWTTIKSISGAVFSSTLTNFPLNGTEYFSKLAIIVTRLQNDSYWNQNHISYFGTPGPTTLDKGSLTLGRSLDVPRISRYDVDTETPRPEKLVVDFDTTVNESPTDISGKGNHGKITSGFSYSEADKAFEGDSTTAGRRIEVTGVPTATGAGNFKMSVSMWFKLKTIPGSGTSRALWGLVGENDGTDGSPSSYASPHSIVDASGNISWAMWGNDIYNQTAIVANRWYHCIWTYSGGTTGRKMFLDGVEQTFNTAQTAALNMVNATSRLAIGIYAHNLSTSPLDGYVSNFKLYDVALEPSEVQKLYRLGRTGRSMVISDTAVGIGKVPEAQLDVRGSARFGGIMSYSVPYYFAQQENTGSYAYDEPIVYETNVVTNYPGSFYSSATNNGYYIPPLPGVYQVHMTAIANGAGSIYIQKFNYVTDSVIMYHDKTHFNFTSGGWESISASGLISIDDPGTQAIRIFADGTSGNGIWAYNSYHGCVSIVWVSNI